MNYATAWKGTETKRGEIAASVRKAYRNREAAQAALRPDFAKAYGATLALDSEGEVKGFEKTKGGAAAKKSLQRLLIMAFPPKGEKESNASSPMELLVAYIAKSGLSAAQCRRAVEAAFKK
jgi:hypothetical protein